MAVLGFNGGHYEEDIVIMNPERNCDKCKKKGIFKKCMNNISIYCQLDIWEYDD